MGGLDDFDLKILSLLLEDSSLTNKGVAARLKIPASTCLERIRRLRSQNIIKGYHADLEIKFLDINLQALAMVSLTDHTKTLTENFRDDMLKLPEVQALYHLGGEFDFSIHLAVRDSDHLRDFVFKALTARPEVGQIQTTLIFEYVKSYNLPLFPDNNS